MEAMQQNTRRAGNAREDMRDDGGNASEDKMYHAGNAREDMMQAMQECIYDISCTNASTPTYVSCRQCKRPA